jgi:dTDP-4-amino-4,6-dideoxygalactose transaminase
MLNKPALLGGSPVFERFVPLVRPTLPPFDDELVRDVAGLFESGILTKGERLREFEGRMATHLGVRHAVGVASCTLGLLLTYHGLALKGEVIVPSFTFMATVHPLLWLGVEPVFADIDPETWNVDPSAVEAAITGRTSAVVAVHNFGNPAPVAELEDVARRHGLRLVFDAAHGAGSLYRGVPVGGFGDAEVLSLSPTKLLVAGEGGIVATNDDDLAEHVRLGREYGNPGDYGSTFAGLNARMPEFNALLGNRSLDILEESARRRNRLAAAFRERLGHLPGLTFQRIHPQDRCSYKDFSLLIDETEFGLSRDDLSTALRAENIDTRKYHHPPVHTHRSYRPLYPRWRDALPVTDVVACRSLSLPIWSHMDGGTVAGICRAIEQTHHYAEALRSTTAATRGSRAAAVIGA